MLAVLIRYVHLLLLTLQTSDSQSHSFIRVRQYQIATITSAGIEISESKSNETNWMFAEGLRGYGAQRS